MKGAGKRFYNDHLCLSIVSETVTIPTYSAATAQTLTNDCTQYAVLTLYAALRPLTVPRLFG